MMYRATLVVSLFLPAALVAQDAKPKKLVILAGPKSHGPVGNGIHDYGWSAKLLKVMLDNSNIKNRIRVEIHLDGWPRDPRTLEDADAIMVISDGRDGDQYAEAPHLASPERVRFMEQQMKRGCGFLTFHFSTFAPNQYARQMLDWSGGFFQWETDGKKQWYSAITTKEAEVKIATAAHPIARGVKPFSMKEEFYFNIRFSGKDERLKPIWVVPSLNGREPDGKVVAWAREREDGGRGFGTTCGHFYENWKHPEFRTLMLNALCWCAKVEVPREGVESRFYSHAEISDQLDPPIRVLLFAGNDAHKWHNWEKTTPAIKAALQKDSRIRLDVSNDIEDLGRRKLADYHVIIQNSYANWQDPKQLSDASKRGFVDYLNNGGGLILIHFANGAWHFSLPNAKESDWPEYRKIVRRVWNHNSNPPSGHDAYDQFVVEPTKIKHAITDGLKPFEVTDELYFRQDGTEKIEPLITARSRITKQDEPLAWVYNYGKARVFQILLGHSEKTYEAFEAREMLRRAVAWCADREVRPLEKEKDVPAVSPALIEGKFGKALNAPAGGAFVSGRNEYREPPLTVDCWAKLSGKQYHILVANELKSSATHWEIFAEAGNGGFTAYLPGYKPDHVRSNIDITDGQWHHLAMIYERERVRLVIDGRVAADQKVTFQNGKTLEGRLAIGSLAGKEIGCGGIVDEVRISKGARALSAKLQAAPMTDERTIGLWHLDAIENGKLADESALKNPAVFEPSTTASAVPPGPSSPDKLDYSAGTSKITLIDRSQNDTYIGVKVDTQGQVFVGGRESLFVFEPDGKGGFRPRRELYHFHQDAIIIGIECHGNDLYVLTCNALYLLPDARVKRDGIKPRRLLWGIPLDLHVSFHCLAWGPEGDLYLNHGDPLLNYGDFSRPDHWGHWTWYLADGSKVPYTGTGAVWRIKPDGTNLKLVATGLRGPVGLCFDKNWNLFTNDNDHESIPDRYGYWKLLHVTPGIDFGWPRGWMASRSPERSDLVEPMISNTGRGVPVGMAYTMDGELLQSRWDSRSINRYQLTPKGSTWTAQEGYMLSGEHIARPTGIAAGSWGHVFATIHYLPGNVGSPHCISDLIEITEPNRISTSIRPANLAAFSDRRILGRIHWGWDCGGEMYQEALRRGQSLLAGLVKGLKDLESVELAGPIWTAHIWLAAATQSREAAESIFPLADHKLPSIRLQAIRALAEHRGLKAPTNVFTRALSDGDLQVQLAALAAFLDPARELPLPDVMKLAAGEDLYLRQTATRILARRATLPQIEALANDRDLSVSLAGVLAAGIRLTVPPHDFVPPKELPLNYSSGNAFFKLTFADEKEQVDLRALGRCGSFTTAEWWKVVPKTDELIKLKSLLVKALDSNSEAVANQAAYYLSLLREPEIESDLQRRQRKRRIERVNALNLTHTVNRAWVIGPIHRPNKRQDGDRLPEDGPIELSAGYGRKNNYQNWSEVDLKKADLNLKIGNNGPYAYMYFRVHSNRRQTIFLPDFSTNIWHNGTKVAVHPEIGMDFELQPGSNDILMTTTFVPDSFRFLVEERVSISLPDKLDGAELARRLREAAQSNTGDKAPAEFLDVNWNDEMKRADVANGRRLFGTLACAKCHAIANEQRGAGAPSLMDVKKRFTIPHVVESILLPSKQVAEPFRASRIELKTGQSINGLVISEQADQIEVLLPDTTRRNIAKKDIEERKITAVSPMPAGLVKTPAELRDLLAYLFSDNPQPP